MKLMQYLQLGFLPKVSEVSCSQNPKCELPFLGEKNLILFYARNRIKIYT